MATAIQFLRSSIASLRPSPPSLSDGMPMVNFNASDPGLYFKLNDQTLMKVGPTSIGDTAPNSSPSGYTLLSKGEMWLDTTTDPLTKPRAVLRLYDGNQWIAGGGEITAVDLPQEPGTILAGPITSPDATPEFRKLEDSDLPDDIDPSRLGGNENGILLIGGVTNGFGEAHLTLGDNSLTTTPGENSLTVEVTAGNIAGVGSDGTIKSGDGHIQLNYNGIYTADSRFKFLNSTGTLLSHGPTELGQNPLTDTHTIIGETTISGDVTLTNVYSLTVGGDGFVGHNMTIGSDPTELLDVYNISEFYSNVFVKNNSTLDVDGNLDVHRDTVIGDSDTQTLTVNATTTIPAAVTIGRACTQETFTVKSNTVIECDLEVQGDFSAAGDVAFPGDVILGTDCSDFIGIQGTQLNTCDIFIGTNVPSPNAEQITLSAATGDITTKGDINVTGGLVVSNPLTASPPNFIVDGATGDATSEGTITADFFVGDGSQLFNLAVPNAMLFHGDIDATAGPVPANPNAGDFYLNTVGGAVVGSWPNIGGLAINQDQFIYFYDDGLGGKWTLGSVQNNQGFVTITTAQDINGSKTFKAHTQFDETVTVAADKATLLGGTLQVEKASLLNETLTVADGKATILGGTLQVKDAATFNNTLTVDAGQLSTFNGAVTVTNQLTTLFAAKDCTGQALLVNGLSIFECLATFNGGLALGPGSDMEINGNLVVKGNTTLGDSCVDDTLTITAVTTINCATEIINTLTVTGTYATTLGGTLGVAGDLAVATNKFTVAALTGNTLVAGQLDVTGSFNVNTNKFQVAAATGNTTVAGTLTVSDASVSAVVITGKATSASTVFADAGTTLITKDYLTSEAGTNGSGQFGYWTRTGTTLSMVNNADAVTLGGTLSVTGDFAVNTNKFTVTAASGNTSIAGTLGVTGATTLSSTLSVTGAATFSSTGAFTGKVSISSSDAAALAITGKATSASTVTADAGTTLVTKDYLTSGAATGTGQFGYWTRTGTTLSMVNNADAVTLGGTLAVTGVVTVTTNVLPAADGGANLGSTTQRFANLYTQDMHFSNEGTTGNDVDGTTGDWTLQEGNDHIYFINNKTGAKFRVVMESVG